MAELNLEDLRISIDHADQALLVLLKERQRCLKNSWNLVQESPFVKQKPNFQGQSGFYTQVLHCMNNFAMLGSNVGVLTIDQAMIAILKYRYSVVQQVHILKQKLKLKAYVPERWKQLLAQQTNKAKALGLPTTSVHSFLETLHQESLFIQQGTEPSVQPD